MSDKELEKIARGATPVAIAFTVVLATPPALVGGFVGTKVEGGLRPSLGRP